MTGYSGFWGAVLTVAWVAGTGGAMADTSGSGTSVERRLLAEVPLDGDYVIGAEKSISVTLGDGSEGSVSAAVLAKFGERLFRANWTPQEGGGRPLTKGTGSPLVEPGQPLIFPRNFNRISGPDANSCAGCHALPRPGGAGDFTTGVFVLGQRFDFATFDGNSEPTFTSADEAGNPTTLQTMANMRGTPGMFGSGYVEMLSRQMTAALRLQRDSLTPGTQVALQAKGVSFGTLRLLSNGTWDTSSVTGLPATSLVLGADGKPGLQIRPFHASGSVISLRQFSNNALNHHHGIQSTERFGSNTDPDGDGVLNEATRAEVTAITVFQATLSVPGRMIPKRSDIEAAVLRGEQAFGNFGCAVCHVPTLPLNNSGWVFTEPNPYNPAGNLRPVDGGAYSVDLTDTKLPMPRLRSVSGGTMNVPLYSDLKIHDISTGAGDPGQEALDLNQPAGSAAFFAGNRKFLTPRLWGAASKPNYFHHGKFTTLREAIEAHAGEASASRAAFASASTADRDGLIEFLKTLRVLPEGTETLIVDERGEERSWRGWLPPYTSFRGNP